MRNPYKEMIRKFHACLRLPKVIYPHISIYPILSPDVIYFCISHINAIPIYIEGNPWPKQ